VTRAARRRWLSAAAVAVIGCGAGAPAAGASNPIDEVDPFVGTAAGAADFGTGGGAGNTFPGATVPFGMVAFSPDTIPSTTNFSGGYTYGDRRLRGFSLTHFSGAGCSAYQDVPILPVAGALTRSPVVAGSSDLVPGLVPRFDHRHESAAPGDYRVTLDPGTRRAIAAQLTATTRTAAARFRFPRRRTSSVLVNAGGSVIADYDARVRVDPSRREISGSATSGRFCEQPARYRVYFTARFSRPFAAYGTWDRQRLVRRGRAAHDASPHAFNYRPILGGPPALPGNPSTTAQAGAYVSFDTRRDRAVEVRVGVSFVSVAGARANLRESAGATVAAVRARARRTWRRALDAVHVDGGRREDRRMFATALYHALVEPSVFSDRDGRYRGMDGRIHRTRRGAHYTDVSGWDVYRGQLQLVAMLDPARAAAIAASLVDDARQSGCLPRWPFAGHQTNVMVGDPSAPIIASTYAFGARAFDARAALRAMVRGASKACHTTDGDYTEREALSDVLRLGYVPHDLNVGVGAHTIGSRDQPWGDVSTTLEYAIADFAISRLARELGDGATARAFAARARHWRLLVDPATRTIAPRLADGAFAPGPGPSSDDGYVEGSSAQYAWLVPQDPAGLFASMGGRAAARARLDALFAGLNGGPRSPVAFLSNEPTLGTPWLYDWLGAPQRAQAIVRRALLQLYRPTPAGMPGNDDGGAMSAWWVFGALGLYPAVPGTDLLALGSPLFPRATIRLPRGTLTLEAPRAARGRPYVRRLRVGGREHRAPWLRFADVAEGGTLHWDLGSTPSSWGSSSAAAPPSFP
jgi:predicted alpha-1,2-mannosidase